jgi:hypothetical protein
VATKKTYRQRPYNKTKYNIFVYDSSKCADSKQEVNIVLELGKYCNVFGACVWLINGFWTGWWDLLTPYTLHSELQAITTLSLFPHFTGNCYTHQCPPTSLVVSWQRIHNSLIVTVGHLKSAFHSLIPLFPSSELPSPELSSILSPAPKPRQRINKQ